MLNQQQLEHIKKNLGAVMLENLDYTPGECVEELIYRIGHGYDLQELTEYAEGLLEGPIYENSRNSKGRIVTRVNGVVYRPRWE